MADAVEIIPICESLNAPLLSFDMPGAGKSGGKFSLPDTAALHSVLSWASLYIQPTCFVIWSRGVASATVLEYLGQNSSKQMGSNQCFLGDTVRRDENGFGTDESSGIPVACAVLDSPFTSLPSVIKATCKKYHENCQYIPRMFTHLFDQFVERKLGDLLQKVSPEIRHTHIFFYSSCLLLFLYAVL